MEYNEELFWQKVEKTDGCWNWIGAKTAAGYGQVWVSGKKIYAHRVSAKWSGKDIDGLVVCHSCDNPRCVNPDHLFVGTRADNNTDARRKGRHGHGTWPAGKPRPGQQGESHYRAKLTKEQAEEIRREYVPFKVSQPMLAARYGVSHQAIYSVLKGLTWRS